MRTVKWFIDNPVSVNLLIAFLVIAGLLSLYDIRREIFPAFSLDRVLVTVVFPGASPKEVEEGICIKIEEAVTGLSGIKTVTSVARENIGTVIIEIETDQDILKIKDDVETRINTINTFPVDSERPIIKNLELIFPVLNIAVSGDVDEATLRNLCESIKSELLSFPEISQAEVRGLKDFEISIEIEDEKLREYNLSFDELAAVIRASSFDMSGGVIRTAGGDKLLRVKGQKYFRSEFEDIVVRADSDGTIVRLHQLAKVKDGFAETLIEGKMKGRRAALVSISKTESEDVIKISDRVIEYINNKQKSLPESINFEILNDTSVAVKSRLDLLVRNGLQGLLLVFICLTIFLNLRLSFWVSTGIPISMLGTILLLRQFDQSLNMMSMFGLIMALGMLVDDAIVVSESIYTELEHNPQAGTHAAARNGTMKVFWPVLAAVSTTIVAFLPLGFMTGVMGKFVRILPITVISCLLVSLIEALIGLPTHLAHYLKPEEKSKRNRLRQGLESLIETFTNQYEKLLRLACEFRYITLGLAIFILCFAIGLVRAGFVSFVIFPRTDSEEVQAKFEFPEGNPFETSLTAVEILSDSLNRAETKLKKKYNSEEVLIKKAYSVAGQHPGPEGSTGSNLGQISVELTSSEKRSVSSAEILNTWREETPPLPGVKSLIFAQRESGPGGKPLEIQLRGNDFAILKAAADELKAHLRTYPGVFDIDDDFKDGITEIELDLKPSARNLGISLADLARQVRYAFYGNEVVRLQRGIFDVKVFLRFPYDQRKFIGTFENMVIRTGTSELVPIKDVANISFSGGTSTIKRWGGFRIISVFADLDEKKANAQRITSHLADSGFLEKLENKYGIRHAFEGQKRETNESVAGLVRGFLLSFIGIFIILATIFKSYLQPIIIMMAIPFGIIGAIFGHLFMGYSLTMLSLFGLVALSGIVVNNSLLMIDAINLAIESGETPFAAAIKSGRQRLRPIVLTSLTTVFGISSIMLERSFQAVFLIPMALSISWGLVFSTCISLLLIPALYLILQDAVSLFTRTFAPQTNESEPPAPQK
ncbi:MAG: hypothetical protein CVV41_18585 [Candidatus Riflebacteria bacterium HGW-Riflebacteria-1]|jgi:multidrug efflux pump subunit AcrB|nr:MAG: hypothetical protein CVV41_18585 [Candidatus Riflebacteria bacterium HGW-Riflebacteria-1]